MSSVAPLIVILPWAVVLPWKPMPVQTSVVHLYISMRLSKRPVKSLVTVKHTLSRRPESEI